MTVPISKHNITALNITPTIVSRSEHIISRANISDNALKVLYRLKNAGYKACLVGGSVRDLLLGREPKDFDVVTDALPEQIRELFRNSRLIGRRFRLAHIRYGRDIIEVATFRGSNHSGDEGEFAMEDGMILRDNVYGDIDDDVWRRDFTVNALYYNIADFSVVDYVGGMADVKAGQLRLIGDPVQRYREDPVRMLRVVRFAVKLGFKIHADTERPLLELGHMLADIPPARLFEEVLKLFMSGLAMQTFERLRQYGLFGELFPEAEACLAEQEGGFPHTFIMHALKNTDARVAEALPVTPAFLAAALLWDPLCQALEAYKAKGVPNGEALVLAGDTVIARQMARVSLPRRHTRVMREIWALQSRFSHRKGKRAQRLLNHPRFRAAYDFLLIRVDAGEPLEHVSEWWTQYQSADEARREEMQAELPQASEPRRRRSRGS